MKNITFYKNFFFNGIKVFVCIILLTSCLRTDSIYNHEGEVIVKKECYKNQVNITTRVKTKDGYIFDAFCTYPSEVSELNVNDTIKVSKK